MQSTVRTAFVLGAGLGKRLRPLTEAVPKPMVPVFNRPLITYAFDQLIDAGIERLVVNTHHCPGAYDGFFGAQGGRAVYRGADLFFVHEPVLLETAGGIRNAARVLGDEPFIVFNGDTLTAPPIEKLVDRHFEDRNEVTVLLRRHGGPLHVQCDPAKQCVMDFRRALETEGFEHSNDEIIDCLFAGVYIVEPAFVQRVPEGAILSVVPVFLEMLRQSEPIAALVSDDWVWADLGNRSTYLDAHRDFDTSVFGDPGFSQQGVNIHPTAVVGEQVSFKGFVSIGAESVIENGAVLEDSAVWKNARVTHGSRLTRCVVRDFQVASGDKTDEDI